jgi:hypothetical protein
MPKNESKNNNIIKPCTHINSSNIINNSYIYCPQCGSISLNNNKKFFFTLKPRTLENETEIDPVLIIKEMINTQKRNFPFLENDYNINLEEDSDKINEIKEKILLYLSKRKLLLLYLQNITKMLNYSDLSFYHCLLETDLYLSKNITEEMTDEDLIYYLTGFFLNSSKFKETDIFEPELYIFCNNDLDYTLNVDQILYYEAKCLKIMGYNFCVFSTFDWISMFMGIGFIFEGEIDINNLDELNDINTYAFKLLVTITPKNIFFKYSPLYNAISIIKICREDKIDKNKINNSLFEKLLNLYNINFKDFEKCYNEIKSILDNDATEKVSSYSNISSKNNKIFKNKTIGEMHYNNNDFENLKNNKFGNRKIVFDRKKKLNLKQNFRDKFKLKFFISNLNSSKKEIINFKANRQNNKNKIKKQNTLQIIECMFGNLPKIKDELSNNKRLKTETLNDNRHKNRYLTIKNNIMKNNNIKNIKQKNRSGNSLDMKLKHKKEKNSLLKFNTFMMRNITFDALKNKDIKLSKKNQKNNINTLNKSSETIKYLNTNPNININIKNNINIFFGLKDKEKNKNCFKYKKSNNNLQINIFKNHNFIMNKNNIENNKPKTGIDNKNEKNINNNHIINAKGKNFIFNNYNKKLDLFSMKKEIFNNQRLPRLKLK